MEPCTYSKEVVELGCRLVEELGFQQSTDTSARWMCHHLAELMDRAENATDQERDAVQRECANLIMRLWVHRATLPGNHRPLQTFDAIIEALARLRGDEPYYYQGLAGSQDRKPSNQVEKWLHIAERVDRTARSLVETCVDSAIECAAEDEKDWIRTGLSISPASDMYANIVIRFLKENGEERRVDQADQVELAATRFQEFGKICKQVADQIRSKKKVGGQIGDDRK